LRHGVGWTLNAFLAQAVERLNGIKNQAHFSIHPEVDLTCSTLGKSSKFGYLTVCPNSAEIFPRVDKTVDKGFEAELTAGLKSRSYAR